MLILFVMLSVPLLPMGSENWFFFVYDGDMLINLNLFTSLPRADSNSLAAACFWNRIYWNG